MRYEGFVCIVSRRAYRRSRKIKECRVTRILTGKPVADAMATILAPRVERLAVSGARPRLAALRVGDRPDDVAYENALARRAASVGVELVKAALPSGADASLLPDTVRSLAVDGDVHGILVFRPLPAEVDEAAILSLVPPEKDVDGVTATQMAALYAMKKSGGAGGGVFFPCTAEAVIRVLDHYEIPIAGRRAVVIGRSTVIGKPAALLLLAKGATVTICHSGTPDLAGIAHDADILVCAAGLAAKSRAARLGAGSFAPGQTVIDVAVNVDDAGLYGDVDTDAAREAGASVTPVPGGLGMVTGSVLMEHVIRAAERT
jgi:methylenetetrahydrofolate dehydrogenase (NADP+)/methenyltetrahydrofolate cyclohydrolase